MARNEGAVGFGCLVMVSFPQWALWVRDEPRGGQEQSVLQSTEEPAGIQAHLLQVTDEENEISCSGEHSQGGLRLGFELGSDSQIRPLAVRGRWPGEREPCCSLFPEAVGTAFPWGSPGISTCGASEVGGGLLSRIYPWAAGKVSAWPSLASS